MKSSEMVGVYVGDLMQNVSPRIGEIDVVWLGFKSKPQLCPGTRVVGWGFKLTSALGLLTCSSLQHTCNIWDAQLKIYIEHSPGGKISIC